MTRAANSYSGRSSVDEAAPQYSRLLSAKRIVLLSYCPDAPTAIYMTLWRREHEDGPRVSSCQMGEVTLGPPLSREF